MARKYRKLRKVVEFVYTRKRVSLRDLHAEFLIGKNMLRKYMNELEKYGVVRKVDGRRGIWEVRDGK